LAFLVNEKRALREHTSAAKGEGMSSPKSKEKAKPTKAPVEEESDDISAEDDVEDSKELVRRLQMTPWLDRCS
jgi:hypothetical protein